MATYIAAIDQGTTGTRCLIFDPAGSVISQAYREHAQIMPQPGWVEHDPIEILQNTNEVVGAALYRASLPARDIRALGITNQRETTLVWNRKTGRPYHHAIVWQCTRTRGLCEQFITQGLEPLVRKRAGLVIGTYFSGPKIRWLLDHVPNLRRDAECGDALFGTIDSWIIWNLTGGPAGGAHVTDVTNASRTMLMNLATRDWDDDLLAAMGVPRAMLPTIVPSAVPGGYGATVADGPFGRAVPICAALGDQQAALVGQTCFVEGEAKNTYGTGSFLLMNTGETAVHSNQGLLTTVAYDLGAKRVAYALEGSIAITGAAVQWLRDNLGLIKDAAETEEIARSVDDSGGVYFVPAFSGLFAPHWDMYARGVITGLTRYATRAHLVRATLEAICYQSREVVDAMQEDAGIALRTLKVDGGAAANSFLMQLQADILGAEVVRPVVRETTSLGAAYAAGLASGVWGSLDELRDQWRIDATFAPQWEDERRREGYRLWQKAVQRSRAWVDADDAEREDASA